MFQIVLGCYKDFVLLLLLLLVKRYLQDDKFWEMEEECNEWLDTMMVALRIFDSDTMVMNKVYNQ